LSNRKRKGKKKSLDPFEKVFRFFFVFVFFCFSSRSKLRCTKRNLSSIILPCGWCNSVDKCSLVTFRISTLKIRLGRFSSQTVRVEAPLVLFPMQRDWSSNHALEICCSISMSELSRNTCYVAIRTYCVRINRSTMDVCFIYFLKMLLCGTHGKCEITGENLIHDIFLSLLFNNNITAGG
jgi:hypothetical protein